MRGCCSQPGPSAERGSGLGAPSAAGLLLPAIGADADPQCSAPRQREHWLSITARADKFAYKSRTNVRDN